MDDYVPKPFKPGELRERVEFWARQAQGPIPGNGSRPGHRVTPGSSFPAEASGASASARRSLRYCWRSSEPP